MGEGLAAYRAFYICKLLSLATFKLDHDLADCFDRWMEYMRSMGELKGDYELADLFKTIALEQIMSVGQKRSISRTSTSQGVSPRTCSSSAKIMLRDNEWNTGTSGLRTR